MTCNDVLLDVMKEKQRMLFQYMDDLEEVVEHDNWVANYHTKLEHELADIDQCLTRELPDSTRTSLVYKRVGIQNQLTYSRDHPHRSCPPQDWCRRRIQELTDEINDIEMVLQPKQTSWWGWLLRVVGRSV